MELTEEQAKRRRGITLQIFSSFISICKKNKLKYYACAGTALGAVRHHGMIPWDDDVDVAMPRPDYERFIEICNRTELGNLELINPHTKRGYFCPFLKLCRKDTTLWENKRRPFVMGVYIDIFPMDGASENFEEFKKDMSYSTKLYRLLFNEVMVHRTPQEFIKEFVHNVIRPRKMKMAFRMFLFLDHEKWKKWVLKKMEDVSRKYEWGKTNYIAVYSGTYGERERMPLSWFEDGSTHVFEDFQIVLAREYEKYLTRMFGDYMSLPPEGERKTHHDVYYLDMDKRIELEQIQKILNVFVILEL